MEFFYALFETVAMAAVAVVCVSAAVFALVSVGRFWIKEILVARELRRRASGQ